MIRRRNLLRSELQHFADAPSPVQLHGAGGVIESGKVARAGLRTLTETIHPYVLDACPDLLSVGYRRRRAGYTFEWPAYSDQPVVKTPDGAVIEMVNIMDVPYFKKEISEGDATQEYHEHLREVLALARRSAIENETGNDAPGEQQDKSQYPLAATLKDFLRAAGPNIPHKLAASKSEGSREAQDYPPEVAELLSTDESIQVLIEDTTSARRFQLPPKDSCISWDTLSHRVTLDRQTSEALEILHIWMGQPEDGNRTKYVGEWRFLQIFGHVFHGQRNR